MKRETDNLSPAQRMLSLMAVLLQARRPLTLSRIQAAMEREYGPPRDTEDAQDPRQAAAFQAGRRKFQRDRDLLARAGVMIRTVRDANGDDAYELRPEDARMPEIALDPEGLRALRLAASLARRVPGFPFRDDLDLAVGKIGAACAGMDLEPSDEDVAAGYLFQPAPPFAEGVVAKVLPVLADAVADRRRVRMTYRSARGEVTNRDVDPWGLYLRAGVWHLVAFCHLRGDVRTFDAHRVLKADAGKPDGFPIPVDFDLARYSSREPWELPVHEPTVVRLRLDPSVAGLARTRLVRAVPVADEPDGTRVVDVTATDVEPLVGLVLSLWGRARILAPGSVVLRLRHAVDALLQAHSAEDRP